MFPDQTDVFVVGGGPAGLAAALAACQAGFKVIVAEAFAPPVDKPCGEGLMPDGVAALEDLGVRIPRALAYPFRGIRFLNDDSNVAADFPDGIGLGIRRTVLHQIMMESAENAGVNLLWRTVVTGISAEGVLIGNHLVRCRWIVAADGGNSRVRRWSGLDRHIKYERRFAFRRHFRVAPWTDFMELHWGHGCQLYVTPVGSEEICVVLMSRNPRLRLEAVLPQFPQVLQRLRGADATSSEQGALSVTRGLARVCSGRVVLVGDASSGVDAIAGEGLCLAFKHAKLLAGCLQAGSLASYQAAHRALLRRPAFMARSMLILEQRPRLRRRFMKAITQEPHIFARLLRIHLGNESPAVFAARSLALGWKLLSA